MTFLTGAMTVSETIDSGDGANWHMKVSVTKYRAQSDGLDLHSAEAALRQTASAEGLDLESLLNVAGRHFENDVIVPANDHPSDSDLANLVDDELRAPVD